MTLQSGGQLWKDERKKKKKEHTKVRNMCPLIACKL